MLRRSAALSLLLLLVLATPASAVITRGWAAGPSPKQVRALAGAVKLDDGRVLVAGGGDATAQYNRTAEIFDPVTNTWSQAASMNVGRWGFVMVKLADGRVLAAGGQYNNGESLAAAEIYDPRTDRWSFAGTMNVARYVAAGVLLGDGTVLVTGGWPTGGSDGIATSERFDPVTNGWAPQLVATFPGARGLHGAATLNDGRVLIAGGTGSSTGATSTATFANGGWTGRGSTNWSHVGATLSTLPDGRVLLVGGYEKMTERYDPAKDSWTPAASLNEVRAQHSAITLGNGRILLAGGDTNATGSEIYDPVSNTMTPAGNLALGRLQATATLLNDGRVLVTGGFTSADGPGAQIWTPTASLFSEPALALGDVAVGAVGTGVVQLTNTSDSPLLTEGFNVGGPPLGGVLPGPVTDADRDGIPDAADRCANLKGPSLRSGCPSGLLADPSIRYRPSGRGIRVVGYYVKATTGARVVVACSKGCKRTVTKGRGSKRVRIIRLNGRRLVNGTRITISVSMPGRLTTTVTDRIAQGRRVEGRPRCTPVGC